MIKEYESLLVREGDPLRGREIFRKTCAGCHKIGDIGVNVAPDISDSRVKTPAQYLTDILDPNRAVDNNYFAYMLQDTSGRTVTGVIASESASSVTLKQAEGKTETVLRSDIAILKSTGQSFMPANLEKAVLPEQMVDLISFVKNWRYLDGKTPLGK